MTHLPISYNLLICQILALQHSFKNIFTLGPIIFLLDIFNEPIFLAAVSETFTYLNIREKLQAIGALVFEYCLLE